MHGLVFGKKQIGSHYPPAGCGKNLFINFRLIELSLKKPLCRQTAQAEGHNYYEKYGILPLYHF